MDRPCGAASAGAVRIGWSRVSWRRPRLVLLGERPGSAAAAAAAATAGGVVVAVFRIADARYVAAAAAAGHRARFRGGSLRMAPCRRYRPSQFSGW